MKYLLGLDVGTTNIKAIAVTPDGETVAYASRPTPIEHPQPDQSEFIPESIWQCVCACVREICEKIPGADIASVGVSSMAETGILIDESGTPLYPFIAWYDFRSEAQSEQLIGRVGKARIYEITGQTASAKYGLTKLMWLRDVHPALFEKARAWLSMEDYILFRLTGRRVSDYSIASRTMAFDIRSLSWSEEILGAAEIPAALFPETVPGGTAIGNITPEAAAETGLSRSAIAATGGHDHACAAAAIGILEDGVILDSMGTAEVSMVASTAPMMNDETLRRYVSFYPHFGKKLYRALTSNQCCGASIEWFLSTVGRDIPAAADEKGISRYDELYARYTPVGSGKGLMFLPFLRGSVEQAGVQGAYWGIRDTHRQDDFLAAVLEGLCFELKRQADCYQTLFGGVYDKLRVVGGLSRSAVLMQLKADVHGSDVSVPENREAAGTGAALLGGLGAGLLSEDELRCRLSGGQIYHPAEERLSHYKEVYSRYTRLREKAMALYRTLAEEN